MQIYSYSDIYSDYKYNLNHSILNDLESNDQKYKIAESVNEDFAYNIRINPHNKKHMSASTLADLEKVTKDIERLRKLSRASFLRQHKRIKQEHEKKLKLALSEFGKKISSQGDWNRVVIPYENLYPHIKKIKNADEILSMVKHSTYYDNDGWLRSVDNFTTYYNKSRTKSKSKFKGFLKFRTYGYSKIYMSDFIIGKEIHLNHNKSTKGERHNEVIYLSDAFPVISDGQFQPLNISDLSAEEKQQIQDEIVETYKVQTCATKLFDNKDTNQSNYFIEKISSYKGITNDHGPFFDHSIIS